MMEDLTGKSNEELDTIKAELTKQKPELEKEIQKIYKRKRELEENYNKLNKDIRLVVAEVERRKETEEAKAILTSEISSIEGFELLGEDELSIITKKMNRTDHGKYGFRPRLRDLERICKEVIGMKQRYPKWKLTNVSRGGQIDTLPPHTHYRYEYKDECGIHFDIGGLKFTSI